MILKMARMLIHQRGQSALSANISIKWILVKVNGKIVANHIFNESLAIVCQMHSELLCDAISLVLGKKDSLNRYPYDIIIISRIELENESYYLRAKKKRDERVRIAVKKNGENGSFTTKYFDLLNQHREERRLSSFNDFKVNYAHRIAKYFNKGLNNDTGGYISTRSFRQFLSSYISSFEKIRLNPTKDYYLELDRNGEFKVTNGMRETTFLSETERTLYNFFCFISLNELWYKAEKIRDFNHLAMPIIVSGFLGRLDCSTDLSLCVEKMRELPHQVILIAEREGDIIEYDLRNE